MNCKSYSSGSFECSYRQGVTQPGEIYESHCHILFESIFVLQGYVSLIIEDREYTLQPYDIAMIPRLKYHSVFSNESTQYQRIIGLFDTSFIPIEIRDDFIQQISKYPIARTPIPNSLLESLQKTFEETNEESINRYGALIKAILIQSFYIYINCNHPDPTAKNNPILQRIIEYIDNHIGEKIFLNEIAAYVYLSPSSVSHLFKAHMKTSLKQYILQKKISYAAVLMQSGVSAIDAAKAIGYENYPNFYKIYKNYFEESPSHQKESQRHFR